MLLATIASVEAPFIALLVLMHQQREARIAELREETHLQVSLHIEREVTMALRQLEEIQRGSGIETEEDVEHLHQMQMNLDPKRLMENLCRDLREEEGDDAAIAP